MSKNRYGLDTSYVKSRLERIIRDLENYKPDEIERELLGIADTCKVEAETDHQKELEKARALIKKLSIKNVLLFPDRQLVHSQWRKLNALNKTLIEKTECEMLMSKLIELDRD